jgi:peptide methionine sulfoxide reductase msrA/msrB
MKQILITAISLIIFSLLSCTQETMKYNKLTALEEKVIIHKGTEMPFSGKLLDFTEKGVYACKRCDTPLYRSEDKFNSHCGWPSFDDEIEGAVKHVPDPDGIRTEIICSACSAHLGHIFEGEHFTPKNVRHCVNSVSLNFIPAGENDTTFRKAIFAGGCFWGMEYYFKKAKGVVSVVVGYTGGKSGNPSYEEVCRHATGHAEAVEVTWDPQLSTYEDLARLFFEIHDPTQLDRQGPDVGDQYRSAVFYLDEEQRQTTERLIGLLTAKGYKIVTEVKPATTFWKAEKYHQDYYGKTGGTPYCHGYTKRF